jgi:hypothetical protein
MAKRRKCSAQRVGNSYLYSNSCTATQVPILIHLGISRYVNDERPFWQFIVSSSTGCSDLKYFEELYNYYTTEKVR